MIKMICSFCGDEGDRSLCLDCDLSNRAGARLTDDRFYEPLPTPEEPVDYAQMKAAIRAKYLAGLITLEEALEVVIPMPSNAIDRIAYRQHPPV